MHKPYIKYGQGQILGITASRVPVSVGTEAGFEVKVKDVSSLLSQLSHHLVTSTLEFLVCFETNQILKIVSASALLSSCCANVIQCTSFGHNNETNKWWMGDRFGAYKRCY